MRIKLTFFKRSGLFYDNLEIDWPHKYSAYTEADMHELRDLIRDLQLAGEVPTGYIVYCDLGYCGDPLLVMPSGGKE